MSFLKGYKTYIIAGLMVIVALLQLVVGDLSWSDFLASDALAQLLTALGLAALRSGVTTETSTTESSS